MERKGSTIAFFLAVIARSVLLAEEAGQSNLLTDFVYLQRWTSQNATIAFDTSRCRGRCTGEVALDVNDLTREFEYEPGIHAAVSYIQDDKSLYEAGLLYVWDWEATKTRKSGTNSLVFPFEDNTFSQDFFQIPEMQAYYRSQCYTAELNYWRTFSTSRTSLLALSGVGGFRFASLQEKFSVTAFSSNNFGQYTIKTANDLIGAQLGFLFQINALQGLHWDLLGKAGVGLNRIGIKSFLGDQSNTIQLRNLSKQSFQTNIFAEGRAGVGYRFIPSLDIHGGYQALYLCGLALAPNQINTSSSSIGLRVKKNGYIVLCGFYVGMDYSF